jgi:hypothetical protein
MKLSALKANPNNPRVIRDARFEKLKNSIQEFPKMMKLRPIVVDNTSMILGGNMRLRALQDLGYKEVPDEWVKQADELTEDEKRRFIIADNVGFGDWEWETLANEWDAGELEEWGLELPGWESEETETPEASKYTNKVDAPVYEPKNKKPEIVELYNADRYKELIEGIEVSAVPDDIKALLKVAASRHIVFNYENMADFYAHSDKEVQRLMEDSALVIIDFNRAIELGFVKLNEEIAEQYQNEYGDE